MLAAWLVGTEHLSARHSGELCLFEIDASAIGPSTRARTGIKAHGDPDLTTNMFEVDLPFDATRPHTWTVIWGDGRTIIGCNDVVVCQVDQAPDYPMFLLIDLFEIGPPGGQYPKEAILHRIRGWQDA